jgi:hypothetical protein
MSASQTNTSGENRFESSMEAFSEGIVEVEGTAAAAETGRSAGVSKAPEAVGPAVTQPKESNPRPKLSQTGRNKNGGEEARLMPGAPLREVSIWA